MLKRKFEPFFLSSSASTECLIRNYFRMLLKYMLQDAQKKIWTILSFKFGFHRIPYLSRNHQKNKTYARTVKLAELIAILTSIPKIQIILAEFHNLQGGKAGKFRENKTKPGNHFIMHSEKWLILKRNFGKSSSYLFLDIKLPLYCFI